MIDDELEADILQAVCVVAVRCDENGDDVVASDALADGVPAAKDGVSVDWTRAETLRLKSKLLAFAPNFHQ